MLFYIRLLSKLHFVFYLSAGLNFGLQAVEFLSVESDTARYAGKEIFLAGNVVVEHPLGVISGQTVQLQQEAHAYFIKMSDQVRISFKEGGQLECGQAEVDCQLMTGCFQANETQPQVIYTESNPSHVSLKVQSREMHLALCQKQSNQETSKEWQIEKITATDNVSVKYDDLFTAFGEILTYQTSAANQAGTIELQGSQEKEMCHVETPEGDFIKAVHIHIDTQSRQSLLTQTHGQLQALAKGEILFSADRMKWDDPHHLLTLEGHVTITQPGMGQLVTDEKVIFRKANFNGKNQVRSVTLPGKSVLTYEDTEKRLFVHTLTCHGHLEVDRCTLETVASSPLDAAGNVIKDQQVHYIDPIGEIYADQFSVSYMQKQGKTVPSHIIFRGNVYICNQGDGSAESLLKQYILADKVEYYPQTKEMYLSAKDGKRVLFYDKIDNLQVSAPSLKIKRDLISKKESIQGYGDVRFNFIEHEFDKLKSRFLLDKTK